MATINLGSIKFNWKGAYNGATAYAVDDVVSSGGSSYVCILASTGNATSNGTYWEQMSSAGTNGTNGTDLTSTLTTQGDILYRDGSGLQRLAKGTAGQVLQMNSGATAPEYGTVESGGLVKLASTTISSNVASVDFNNTIITSTYDNYYFVHYGIKVTQGNDDIGYRVSTDNGSSYATTSGNFRYSQINAFSVGGSENYAYQIAGLDINANGNLASGSNTLYGANNTSMYKAWTGMQVNQNHGSNSNHYGYDTKAVVKDNAAINFVSFFNTTGGNFSAGTVTCYGIKK